MSFEKICRKYARGLRVHGEVFTITDTAEKFLGWFDDEVGRLRVAITTRITPGAVVKRETTGDDFLVLWQHVRGGHLSTAIRQIDDYYDVYRVADSVPDSFGRPSGRRELVAAAAPLFLEEIHHTKAYTKEQDRIEKILILGVPIQYDIRVGDALESINNADDPLTVRRVDRFAETGLLRLEVTH